MFYVIIDVILNWYIKCFLVFKLNLLLSIFSKIINVDVVKNSGLFFIYILVVIFVIRIVMKMVIFFVNGIMLVCFFLVLGWFISLNWWVRGVIIISKISVIKKVVYRGINCK